MRQLAKRALSEEEVVQIKCPAGTFEVPEEFTLREMKTIKNISGLLPGQIEEALENGDTSIVAALVVVIQRVAQVLARHRAEELEPVDGLVVGGRQVERQVPADGVHPLLRQVERLGQARHVLALER